MKRLLPVGAKHPDFGNLNGWPLVKAVEDRQRSFFQQLDSKVARGSWNCYIQLSVHRYGNNANQRRDGNVSIKITASDQPGTHHSLSAGNDDTLSMFCSPALSEALIGDSNPGTTAHSTVI